MNPVDMEEISKKTKRKKNQHNQQDVHDEDRISCLPEALIHHILSFLKIYDVIRTSFLSRRWRHLWRTTPVLDFNVWGDFDVWGGLQWPSHKDPNSIVPTALMLYEGQKVRKFSFMLHQSVSESHLDSWIRFASRRDVEELDLKFSRITVYEMPRYLLDCLALRALRLACCGLNLLQSLRFHFLTGLCLRSVQMTKLDVSGCPLLEGLIMDQCQNCIEIYAPNQKLRYLEITDYSNYYDLTVYAPNLLTLKLVGHFKMFYKFKNLSSIESANLEVEHNYIDYRTQSQSLVELLKSLSNAKTLQLSQPAIEILSYGEWNAVKWLHLSATCLKLEIEFKNYEFLVVPFLLMSCPCLETLLIYISIAYGTEKDISLESFETALSTKFFELALSTNLQLKTLLIHMSNFPKKSDFPEKSEMEIKLIKLLLKCCRVLNKVVISFGQPPLEAELLLGLTMKLLAFPRASANAEIHISS